MEKLREPAAGTEPRADVAEARWRIGLYFGVLVLALGLGRVDKGLANLPVTFILKDQLQLKSSTASLFWALIDIPLYVGFAFGFVRDRWRPFGWGDRGYFLL